MILVQHIDKLRGDEKVEIYHRLGNIKMAVKEVRKALNLPLPAEAAAPAEGCIVLGQTSTRSQPTILSSASPARDSARSR